MSIETPFARSYWVIPGQLLAGFYPGDKQPKEMQLKLERLVRAGVTRVINLMEPDEKDHDRCDFIDYTGRLTALATRAGRSIQCERFPIEDQSIPSPDLMREILRTIDEELAAGGVVYVHCWGGRGRTATVVGCYLVEHGMADGHGALRRILELTSPVRHHFRITPENPPQCDFVLHWKSAKVESRPANDDRFCGCLLGLAVGDAVGTALEFKAPGTFRPIDDMVGGGPFGLRPGEWTDDTSMALCLAESLLACGAFDPKDQMERYVRWWKKGHLSVTGRCFDIGITISGALQRFLETGDPFSGPTDPNTAGNGSIMRLAPVGLFFSDDPAKAIHYAAESSRTTHGAVAAVDGCRYLAALILGALQGATKEELLSPHFCPLTGYWETNPLHPAIDEIASGSFKRKQPPEIRGTGYVVDSLEAALWALHNSNNFRDGCLKAANLGIDADTTAAVYGQIAGAFYAASGIPRQWLDRLAWRSRIEQIASRLRPRI